MRCLKDVAPTPEQLSIVSRNQPGVEVIRGAAGSGKTTTALLRLRSLIGVFLNRKRRHSKQEPVKVLVLTYNRTLRGYIQELINHQIAPTSEVIVEVSTFGKWSIDLCSGPSICEEKRRKKMIKIFGERGGIKLDPEFLADEVDYILGRFSLDKITDYLSIIREGRGVTPRIDKALREEIINKVIYPYQQWLKENDLRDWDMVAMSLVSEVERQNYDVIVCDEAQDFTANQIRAVKYHVADVSSLTFIVDTAQRIYARGFTWIETGIVVRPENSFRLSRNYRNTKQIAAFASALVEGIPTDPDFTIPDFNASCSQGDLPVILEGNYSSQVEYAVRHIKDNINISEESVAFLHPKGWNWFKFLKTQLSHHGIEYVDITRQKDWPEGDENVALSTLHSAKGLEFDHIIILGLNKECFPVWEDVTDHRYINTRKLLAMGIARAKKTVLIGYKFEDRSELIDLFNLDTFELVKL